VLLGKYQIFINAINTRDLASLVLGESEWGSDWSVLHGILTWLFRRYHDLTVAALIGLMIGSLRKVWPWKEVVETMVDRHGDVVPLVERNLLPSVSLNGSVNPEVLWAVGAALLGIVVLFGVEWIATRRR
jgi:putative membrane protein